MNPGDPRPDLRASQLSVDRAKIEDWARRDIEQHFEFLKKNFNGPYNALHNISVDELVREDLLMWYRVQSYRRGKGMVSDEDLATYRTNVEMNRNPSRTAIAASIAEIIQDTRIERGNKKDAKK